MMMTTKYQFNKKCSCGKLCTEANSLKISFAPLSESKEVIWFTCAKCHSTGITDRFTQMVDVFSAQVIFVNHSGGKDSQALLAYLISLGLKDKLVVVHSDLGEMEHEEMKPWIETISFGLPVHVVKPERDFFQLVRAYKKIPSGKHRFCTSKLKTDPVAKFIVKYMDDHSLTHSLNALGIRRSESAARESTQEYERHQSMAPTKKRYVTTWNPLKDWSEDQVFDLIKSVGQTPHRVYSEGWSRLSCVFCVLGRKAEHIKAAEVRPDLFQKMAQVEREIGKTIRLKQVKGEKIRHYLDEYIEVKKHG